jgi:hypothetical protein
MSGELRGHCINGWLYILKKCWMPHSVLVFDRKDESNSSSEKLMNIYQSALGHIPDTFLWTLGICIHGLWFIYLLAVGLPTILHIIVAVSIFPIQKIMTIKIIMWVVTIHKTALTLCSSNEHVVTTPKIGHSSQCWHFQFHHCIKLLHM